MMRVSLAERLRLFGLIARRAFRSLLGRISTHPLLRWRFGSATTDRLIIAPQDLRTADATRASEIYAGRFAFAGKVVICDRRSPFEMTPPSDEWAVTLLSFTWLRHLRAADSAISRANARSLIDDWINLQGGWHPVAWRVDILSRRIVSWLSQAPFILQDADARFYRRFLRSLTRQVHCLRRTLMQSRDGLPRLQAVIALNYATLCIQGQSGHLRSHARRLVDELQRQILPDGGHVSRNPGALTATTVSVRETLRAAGLPEAEAAVGAHTLLGYLIGEVALEARERAAATPADDTGPEARFHAGLDRVLAGLIRPASSTGLI